MYGQRCCSSLHSHIHASGYCCRTSNPFRSCAYATAAAFNGFRFYPATDCAGKSFLSLSVRGRLHCYCSAVPCMGSDAVLRSTVTFMPVAIAVGLPIRSVAVRMRRRQLSTVSVFILPQTVQVNLFSPLCPWSAALLLFRCPMYGRQCLSSLHRNIHASGCYYRTSTLFRSCAYATAAAFQRFPFSSCHRLCR